MNGPPNGDPVTSRSLSGPLLVCSLLMVAALGWAIGDDFAKHKNLPRGIRQIYVAEAQIVDRCSSCHLKEHPNPKLMQLHAPARFGCSLCHNGNGVATTTVAKAHGLDRGWAWPLYGKQNVEAGCVQCHERDRVLESAETLNLGRDLYQQKGCAGCHRHEQYDREADGLKAVRLEAKRLGAQQERDRVAMEREIQGGDGAGSDEEARRHYARAETLRVGMSARNGWMEDLTRRATELELDARETGPSLKQVRGQLKREWIPGWLRDPQGYRAGTRMPKFRLSEDEVRSITAFIWQAADEAALSSPSAGSGDSANGKELFGTRGCLACHSIGEGAARMGADFAPNLSRLGEKTTAAWVARWVLNPSAVRRQASMPSLRLTQQEAWDIAAYLIGPEQPAGRDSGASNDARLAATGKKLVARYGCAGCHEIAGFEQAVRVGTELTHEGSKLLEQMDFGLLLKPARDAGWYNTRGFLEHKLREPAGFDKGRAKAAEDKLRMPDISLTATEVNALTTFLLGSVDVPTDGAFRMIPKAYRFQPEGTAKDIQDGWWVVKKYNCMGCHEMRPGQKSALSSQARYQDADGKEQLPPALLEEGARVRPEWLAKFLADPNTGVRPYLDAHMPKFGLSANEVRILVRFFGALSKQPATWVAPELVSLDEREREMARALFSSRAAPCLKCHLTGDARHDRTATAPNFLTAAERLQPGWTLRWMTEPQNMSPGTAMPSGLFRKEGGRWVFAGETPAQFDGYTKDHAELLVRYMMQMDAPEQRRLMGMMPAKP